MEEWKDIEGYEGLYQISSLGNVKSLKRLVKISKTKEKYKEVPEHILKPTKNRYGYLYVSLARNGVSKNVRIHRVVAETFLEKSPLKTQVNHINGKKTDNRLENLEWVTCKENLNKAWEMGLCENNRKRARECLLKRIKQRDFSKVRYKTVVVQYDLEGNFIKKYRSLFDAEKQTGIKGDTIGYRIRNNVKKGYIWKREDR